MPRQVFEDAQRRSSVKKQQLDKHSDMAQEYEIRDSESRRSIDDNIILSGDNIILSQLQPKDTEALYEAGKDPSIWRYTADQPGRSIAAMGEYAAEALKEQREGTGLTSVITYKDTGKVVGVIRMYDVRIEPGLRKAEVGTWLSPEAQGKNINTEAKYLLLSYAFDTLNMDHIVFSANSDNQQSIKAMKKLGASFVREEKNKPPFVGAEPRASVIYEITQLNWNQRVKADLESKLHRD